MIGAWVYACWARRYWAWALKSNYYYYCWVCCCFYCYISNYCCCSSWEKTKEFASARENYELSIFKSEMHFKKKWVWCTKLQNILVLPEWLWALEEIQIFQCLSEMFPLLVFSIFWFYLIYVFSLSFSLSLSRFYLSPLSPEYPKQ